MQFVVLGFLKATNANSGVAVSDVCKNDDVLRGSGADGARN